jgi:hypothetical protein
MVLILEQGGIIALLVWFGVKFGKWSAARNRLSDATDAYTRELQKHRPANTLDAANFVATFVHDDRKESA